MLPQRSAANDSVLLQRDAVTAKELRSFKTIGKTGPTTRRLVKNDVNVQFQSFPDSKWGLGIGIWIGSYVVDSVEV
jgi:hypothetical protein